VQTESSTGTKASSKVRTTLTIQVEAVDFDGTVGLSLAFNAPFSEMKEGKKMEFHNGCSLLDLKDLKDSKGKLSWILETASFWLSEK